MQLAKKNRPKKILFVCPHPVGYAPGQRLKYEQYFQAFEEAGYEVTVSSFMSEAFQKIVYKKGHFIQKTLWTLAGYAKRLRDLAAFRKYDIVYVFLWVTPFAPPVFEHLTRRLAKKLVYDIDDLVFLNPPSSANPLIHYLRSPRNHLALMKSADHVITCTPYLDQFVRKYNTNTTDISSTIDTDRYKPKTNYEATDTFVIGWSGSHSTSKYLHLLDEVFIELAKEHPFKLVVMGDPTFTLTGVNVEAIAWKEEYEIDVIRRFDIGVYPLPNEEWVLGKSGLKALQYMALGIPTVATNIGTILRIIDDGNNGFLVTSKEEWKQRLLALMKDAALRKSIGTVAVKTVEQSYSLHANKGKYLAILDNLTGS